MNYFNFLCTTESICIDGLESGISLIRDVGDKENTHHEEIIKEIENSGNFNCY